MGEVGTLGFRWRWVRCDGWSGRYAGTSSGRINIIVGSYRLIDLTFVGAFFPHFSVQCGYM